MHSGVGSRRREQPNFFANHIASRMDPTSRWKCSLLGPPWMRSRGYLAEENEALLSDGN